MLTDLSQAHAALVWWSALLIQVCLHSLQIRSLVWNLDDSKLISAGTDGAVYEWNLSTGKRETECVLKSCSYNSVTVSPDSKVIFAVGSDQTLKEIADSLVSPPSPSPDVPQCCRSQTPGLPKDPMRESSPSRDSACHALGRLSSSLLDPPEWIKLWVPCPFCFLSVTSHLPTHLEINNFSETLLGKPPRWPPSLTT